MSHKAIGLLPSTLFTTLIPSYHQGGDSVADTPAHEKATSRTPGVASCWRDVDPPLNTCPDNETSIDPGLDPIDNYMNYLYFKSGDWGHCYEEYARFTPGQIERMTALYETQRLQSQTNANDTARPGLWATYPPSELENSTNSTTQPDSQATYSPSEFQTYAPSGSENSTAPPNVSVAEERNFTTSPTNSTDQEDFTATSAPTLPAVDTSQPYLRATLAPSIPSNWYSMDTVKSVGNSLSSFAVTALMSLILLCFY